MCVKARHIDTAAATTTDSGWSHGGAGLGSISAARLAARSWGVPFFLICAAD